MIERLLPDSVAVATCGRDCTPAVSFADERAAVSRAVESRQQEFLTGRECARRALAQLGVGPVAIARGDGGEPLWPSGIVGSITHCEGYRAAAVARDADACSLGIDAEPAEPLPEGVLEQVAFGPELDMVARVTAPASWDRVLFSAKESIYKAWFPLTRRWLGFEDVALTVRDDGSFTGTLLVPGPVVDGRPLERFQGRWMIEAELIGTAVLVPRAPAGARPGPTIGAAPPWSSG